MSRYSRRNPHLPQDDSARGRRHRTAQLVRAKEEYIWNDQVPSVKGIPMSKIVPESNKPTLAWFVNVIDVAMEVAENTLANGIEAGTHKSIDELNNIRNKLDSIKGMHATHERKSLGCWVHDLLFEAKQLLNLDLDSVSDELLKLKDLVDRNYEKMSLNQATPGLLPYKDLFETINLNPVAEQFQSDSLFAHYRIAGPNPMLITSISIIPPKFAVTEAGYQGYMGSDDSLAEALADKRLFILDYKELQPLVDNPGTYKGKKKQLFAPLVLLVRPKGTGLLAPVAIQRTQKAEECTVVYATEDKRSPDFWPWQTAKSIVEVAEGNYHELFVHLARTHLFIEPFAIATQRNLARSHPLNILLTPHFEGTLFINNSATGSLIADGGPIDQIFAGHINHTQQAAGGDRLRYDFYENMLPTDLVNRGVDDTRILPHYPYRDDALLIWAAIERWISDYVNIYYDNDNDIISDTELAAWATDVTEQGKIKGFVPVTSKHQLVQVITMIIFTGSAQHAAVNFPQSSVMTYAPAVTGALWGGDDPKGNTEQAWLETLAPLEIASQQLDLLHLIGGVYYRMLGNYQANEFPYLDWFEDKRVSGKGGALERFQQSLIRIEAKIEIRNHKRGIPYPYLLPSKIPMSINI